MASVASKAAQTPLEFFNSLNFSQLPKDEADYIKNDLLNDKQLASLSKNSEKFTMVVNLISEYFPAALTPVATSKKEPEIKKAEPTPEPVQESPPSKTALEARIGVLKEELKKNPKDKIINSRIKLLEEMIKEAK